VPVKASLTTVADGGFKTLAKNDVTVNDNYVRYENEYEMKNVCRMKKPED